MFRLGNLPTRLWNMFRKQRLEQDLSTELQAHLDLLTEENIRRGMNPTEAAHAARREFGGVEQTDRKSTRLNSSHLVISYAVFCLKKKNTQPQRLETRVHRHSHRAGRGPAAARVHNRP